MRQSNQVCNFIARHPIECHLMLCLFKFKILKCFDSTSNLPLEIQKTNYFQAKQIKTSKYMLTYKLRPSNEKVFKKHRIIKKSLFLIK